MNTLGSLELNKVEQDLSEIERRYNKPSYGTLMDKLMQEFDTVGIVPNGSTKEDIIKSSLMVINMYRKLILQQRDNNTIVNKLKLENSILKNKIEVLQEELRNRLSSFERLHQKLAVEKLGVDNLVQEKQTLLNEVQTLKSVLLYKEKVWKLKLNQMNDNEAISLNKNSEERYKALILKLHNVNRALIGELTNFGSNKTLASMEIGSLD
uniref:Uncharacterized protein n=1 Tax=Photinus pyralis TaxID=7054 RepID=A0A1Y1JUE1_PHOPY